MVFDNIGNGVYFVDAAKGLTLHAAKEQFTFNVSGDVVHFIHPVNKDVGKFHINDIKKSNGTVHGTNITDVMASLHQVNNKNFNVGGGYDMVGAIVPFATTTPPSYALVCDGASYLKSSYPALYAKIGDTYTATPSATHFNVPDSRGLLMKGAGGSIAVGETGGSDQLTLENLPAHNHKLIGNNGGADENNLSSGFLSSQSTSGDGFISSYLGNQAFFNDLSIDSTGSGEPHTHPYLGVLYCIIFQ